MFFSEQSQPNRDRITRMNIHLTGPNPMRVLESALAGVRRSCPGILQNFHVRKLSNSPEIVELSLNFYPHAQHTLDVALLTHAIEYGVSYIRLQNTQLCPQIDGAAKVGTLFNVQQRVYKPDNSVHVYADFSDV
jgi:hypothetical protein